MPTINLYKKEYYLLHEINKENRFPSLSETK